MGVIQLLQSRSPVSCLPRPPAASPPNGSGSAPDLHAPRKGLGHAAAPQRALDNDV